MILSRTTRILGVPWCRMASSRSVQVPSVQSSIDHHAAVTGLEVQTFNVQRSGLQASGPGSAPLNFSDLRIWYQFGSNSENITVGTYDTNPQT